ncbi:MAG: protein kinase [Sulfuricurvum sp.]|uniref:protein kinase domain-containing protein n=1 Tax=Sulfuricurvum sp. TaxID=2025608 RepID=UPI0025FA9EB0|nr:protein kinase [Sulfuricurvum sp.]MBV5322194.1 protein kinase [Sulfuricurvum sp.]
MFSRNYQIIDTLHENVSTVVYRALRTSDAQQVIIKMLKPGEILEHRVTQFMNEQLILSSLKSPNIVKLIEIVAQPSEYLHVFEDIGGRSLYEMVLEHRFSIFEGLNIAIKVAEALHTIHQKHIIHADVNPKNIIYNRDTKELQIIDFGYSIHDNHFRYNSDIDVGTSGNLMYMSPEQTGRTKQKIDSRSDLYSLGMTLYHLFSGHSPFEAKDRYELIHKQIALRPTPIETIIDDFPEVLASIINRLTAKKADERYQNSEALLYDLKYALQTLNTDEQILPFEIGTHDQPSIRFGDHIFGRDVELALLKEAVDEISLHKSVRLVVSGLPGVGKTRFVEEFLTLLNTGGSHILRGKFEQYRSSHPYLSIKQLFTQLKMVWKRHLNGNKPFHLDTRSTQTLIYYFPELREMLLTKEVVITAGDEMHHQLPYAFQQLLTLIVSDTAPLVIFMDDVQWADAASLDLIHKTIFQLNVPNLHFIFSYRENEISSNPNSLAFVQKIRGNRFSSLYIFDLTPLSKFDVRSMFQTLLATDGRDIDALSDIIYKKTDGNPFYIKTLLYNLIEAKEILYKKGKWHFQIEKIRSYGSTVNIAGLITDKFSKLTTQEQSYLHYLSVLGNRFDANLTRKMMSKLNYPDTMMEGLESKGFIELFGGHYQFVHDMIQDHVITSISPTLKETIHRVIGEFLERAYRSGDYNDIISVVSHLNQTHDRGKWHKHTFRLNLKAFREMVLSGSYSLALDHLRWMQTNGFNEVLLQSKHSDAFDFKVLKIKVLYLNSLHAEAHSSLQILMDNSTKVPERLICFTLFKDLCVTKGGGFESLLLFGNSLLNTLGMATPEDSCKVKIEVDRLKHYIGMHPFAEEAEAIIRLPKIKSHAKDRIIAILVNYWEAAYYLADIPLMEWAYLSIIEVSFRHGNTNGSPFGYVLYGAQMVSECRYKEAYRFGEAALKLNHLFGDQIMLPKVHNFMANFISPYTKPLERNIPLYQKSLHQSKINGDIIFGTWANFLMHMSEYLCGKSLESLRVNILEESHFLLNSGDKKMIAIFEVLHSVLRMWQDRDEPSLEDEASAIALWEEEQFFPALAWYGILKAQTCWIEGNIDQGLEYLHRFVRSEANEVIMFPKIRLHPIRVLLLLEKTTPLTLNEEVILQDDLKQCEAYSLSSPKEFKFWKLLIQAKRFKGGNSYWDIAKYFDKALNEARRSNNPFNIVASAMCAGRFWSTKRFEDLSRFYFSEAVVGLNQWGAYRSAERLKSKLHVNTTPTMEPLGNSSNSSLLRAEPTNYRSLLKSYYALSQSMEKKELLQTLMQAILENATASKAVLIFKEEEIFYTSAEMIFKNGKIDLYHTKLSDTHFVPFHLITHAIDTQHKVVQNSPSESGKFQYDDYFRTHRPISSVAIPTLVEGSVRGVLYLENEEVSTPLNTDTLQTLRLLLTQAAIIYKNTLLYDTLKSNEEKLNKAQQISHVGGWEYDSVSNEIIWSAETYRIYELKPFSISIDNDWFFAHIYPDDVELIQDAVEKAFSGERRYDVTHRILTANGNIRTVHQRAEVYWENDHQKFSGTIQDITETKRTEEMIDRLSQVVNQTPLATIITDPNGVIKYVNNQTLKLTGYFSRELINKQMRLFNSGSHPKSFYEDLWSTISKKRSFWRGTIINRMKNGELRDCASTIFPIFNTQNEIINFVTIQDDVTERNMKDRLFLMQTRQAQMGEMLSMIAHQWRQPLSIMGALISRQKINIMLERSTIENIVQSFDEMEIQIQHLSHTISDFKDFFKPDKEMAVTKSSIIVSKTLELVEHSLMNRNINVTVEHLNDYDYRIYDNELIQVMLNLIKNAQDAFEERAVPDPRILIYSDQQEHSVIITVEDNAGGILPEIIGTIFSPYTSTKKENGTGLGLYMSKTIIDEHCHGSISVENIRDGVLFTLRFPIQ